MNTYNLNTDYHLIIRLHQDVNIYDTEEIRAFIVNLLDNDCTITAVDTDIYNTTEVSVMYSCNGDYQRNRAKDLPRALLTELQRVFKSEVCYIRVQRNDSMIEWVE